MKFEIYPPWSCLPASFSMACNIPFNTFIGLLGHDGSELPYCNKQYKAGFHIQECIHVVQKLGWTCTPIELFPKITPDYKEERIIYFPGGNMVRFLQYLTQCKTGVIEGYSQKRQLGHAVSWDGIKIYDPRGIIYSFAEHQQFDFIPRCLWILKN